MSTPQDQIVFEDLHGEPEDKPVTVDLDAGSKDTGISRAPDEQSADDDGGNDDNIEFDGLRSAYTDDDESDDSAGKKADDDDDASKAGGDDDYSKKVKARIAREQRAKRKERQRGDYWENQAKQLAKGQYERDKKTAEKVIEQADSAIEQAAADLEQAIEDGKTKDQVRLTQRLTDLKADKVRAEVSLEDLSPDGNVQPFDGKVAPDTASSQANKADDWKSEQQDWYGAKGFERQTRLANRLDREVFADGYDPATEEYFEELNRRIKEKEPSLFDDTDDTDDTTDHGEGDKGRGKTVVTPVSRGTTRRSRRSGNKVELNEADFENMRRFNLDPNDPEVLKEYARNKQEAESGDQR